VPALITAGTRVLPEWIDYNGHVMDGFYLVICSDATEGVLAALGFGAAYLERTGCTIYTAEAHLTYRREVSLGTPLSFETQVIDHDAKRIHLVHDMLDAATGERLATVELMFLHVSQETGKVEEMLAAEAARVAAMAHAHADLPRPPDVGRRIGMHRDRATG